MVDSRETTVEDIRARNDIVEVISEFVRLRKAGRSFKGLCPFHKEKTPSFVVNPERQMYHCFGCGVGGDVFSFIMDHEKLDFPEALRYLAERAGLPPPRARAGGQTSKNDPAYRANEFAARFFQEQLKSPAGKQALSYLRKRGLSPEVIALFQIGFAPPGWNDLLNAAAREGLGTEALAMAGLVGKGERGWYDRFRNRIMFPILEVTGRVVGLGGRVLGDQEPKYLNSPETPVFRKGAHLYGLNWTRGEIGREDRALLVEGYLDLVALKQYGIENVVASMGTALTSEAARRLSRLSKRVTIVNDGDEAGRKAAVRSAEVLLAEGFRVHVAVLPAGTDPDSYVRSSGAEVFRRLVRDAPGIVNFLFREADDYESREKATREVLNLFSRIDDPIRRGWYVKELAERSGLDEKVLQRAAARKTGLPRNTPASGPRKSSADGALQAERGLVKYLLDAEMLEPEVVERIRSCEFRDAASHRLAGVLLDALKEGHRLTATEVVSRLQDRDALALLAAVSLKEDIVDEAKQIRDYLSHLRKRELRERITETKGEMREAERREDEEALRRLQVHYLDLMAEIKGLVTGLGNFERSSGR
ncbi:MAG: DNA primase [Candidatus Eisenbacteria sp.]|nr:DNA primase [Candidatus Eisenbacteria bacterium]